VIKKSCNTKSKELISATKDQTKQIHYPSVAYKQQNKRRENYLYDINSLKGTGHGSLKLRE